MKQLLFLYNPTAGKGQIKNSLSGIVDEFTKSGYLVTVYPTQGKGDAADAAALLGIGYDRVVCAGGDGTLSETAAGLMRLPEGHRPPLGYIPAGSTNDCAHNFRLPAGALPCAGVAAAGVLRPCDMGTLNGRPFLYVAAFGAFTDVAYDTPQDLKNTFGHLAYILAAVSRMPTIAPYDLTIRHDGGTLEGKFLLGLVCNTLSVGGIKPLSADQVALDDGLFEVILLRPPKKVADLQQVLQTITTQKPAPGDGMLVLRTSRLTITGADPLPWTTDGEYGGTFQHAEVLNHPRALSTIQGP